MTHVEKEKQIIFFPNVNMLMEETAIICILSSFLYLLNEK